MSVARIQIDFGMLPGEKLAEILGAIGDMVMPFLDPHEDHEPCVRWVQIEAFQFAEGEYNVSFSPEEEELLDELPTLFGEPFSNN